MIFRAGFALNIAGSFVNGLMPFRAFVAMTMSHRKEVRAEGSANDVCSFVSVERAAHSSKHRHRLRPTGRRSGGREAVGRGDMPRMPRSPEHVAQGTRVF